LDLDFNFDGYVENAKERSAGYSKLQEVFIEVHDKFIFHVPKLHCGGEVPMEVARLD
jgi:hypothetical protein